MVELYIWFGLPLRTHYSHQQTAAQTPSSGSLLSQESIFTKIWAEKVKKGRIWIRCQLQWNSSHYITLFMSLTADQVSGQLIKNEHWFGVLLISCHSQGVKAKIALFTSWDVLGMAVIHPRTRIGLKRYTPQEDRLTFPSILATESSMMSNNTVL